MRHKTSYDGQWFFALGTGSGVCAQGWPAVKLDGSDLFVPSSDDDAKPSWLVVTDLYQWEAFEIQWRGSLYQKYCLGLPGTESMAAAMKGGNVESLLVIAARPCFWYFPKMPLAQLHKDICDGVGVSGDKIGTILVKLIKNIVVGITDDELLAILRLRLKSKNDFTELLKTDELKESLSKDDQVMLDELEKDDERHDVMQADIQEIVRNMQKSKAGGKAKAKAKAKGQSKYPSKVMPQNGDWSEADVQSMLPPFARIYQDNNNQRWLLTYGVSERKSRSFALHGHNGAALALMDLAWRAWEFQGGFPCPITGVLGCSGVESRCQ